MKVSSHSSASSNSGFSLMELLPAMVIFSIVLVGLAYALEASLSMINHRTSTNSSDVDLRTVVDTLRRDLQGVVVDRSLHHTFGDGVNDQLRGFVDSRKFIPFEVSRTEGTGISKSFLNGEDTFSSLLFAAVVSSARYTHPIREQKRMSNSIASTGVQQSPDAIGEVCLVGYYVAYTPDSSQANASKSMKLYRHFRSGGIASVEPSMPDVLQYGEGHSNGILAYVADVFNPASSRTVFSGLSFENQGLPFLLAGRYPGPDNWPVSPPKPTQPWPKYSIAEELSDPPPGMSPPAFTRESWLDPKAAVHNYVFGDEEIARFVVEFQCTPYKKVETSPGKIELLTTEKLNRHLGLVNKDWPVLVKPDFIDITLGVVGVDAAVQMTQPEDWSLPASKSGTSELSPLERIKKQQLRRYSIRVPVN